MTHPTHSSSDTTYASPSALYAALNHDTDAVRKINTLLWQGSSQGSAQDAFQKEFMRYGGFITDPALQAEVLLNIAYQMSFRDPTTWQKTRTQLALCHEAGWGCTDALLSQKLLKNSYDAVWLHWEKGTEKEWREVSFLQMEAPPAFFEDLKHAFSLFLKLLPPPAGLTPHIVCLLSLLHLPLLHAVRQGFTTETLPRIPEQAFHDALLVGLFCGETCVEALTPALSGKILFEEARAWTEDLSPSFFEHLLVQFRISNKPPPEAERLGVCDQKERTYREEALQYAQRLQTAFLLTQALPTAEAPLSSRKRL